MTNHTPGPWINCHWDGFGSIAIRIPGFTLIPGNLIAQVEAPRVVGDGRPEIVIDAKCVEVAEANAALIAASPNLLAACKLAALEFELMEKAVRLYMKSSADTWHEKAMNIRAVIDKAEGNKRATT